MDPGVSRRSAGVRLHVSARSIVAAMMIVGVGLVARVVFWRAHRVLGWLVVAVLLAGLIHPVVTYLSRWMRRWLAVVLVLFGIGTSAGLLAYGTIGDVQLETARLQRVAPEAALRIERSATFGKTARDLQLAQRVKEFVDELPSRLAGGDTGTVIRSAATRTLAYLATGVLMLFLLAHGPRLCEAALRQISDPRRRARVDRVVSKAYRRAWSYIVRFLGLGVFVGLLTFVFCRFAHLPGAVALGLIVGVLALVPDVGIIIGSFPIVLLAGGLRTFTHAVVLFVAFIFLQIAEVVFDRRYIAPRSMHVGPVIPTLVGMIGFNLYGLGGAICSVGVGIFAVALADELTPDPDAPEPAFDAADPDAMALASWVEHSGSAPTDRSAGDAGSVPAP